MGHIEESLSSDENYSVFLSFHKVYKSTKRFSQLWQPYSVTDLGRIFQWQFSKRLDYYSAPLRFKYDVIIDIEKPCSLLTIDKNMLHLRKMAVKILNISAVAKLG